MPRLATLAALLLTLLPAAAMNAQTTDEPGPALRFEMETLDGETVDLGEKYAGKVVLFVNVASKCGFTPQYEGLQDLHAKYAEQGLAIVGVPCNQFGWQEPGSSDEIRQFCSTKYGVEFDMLAKVDVNGKDQCPLYAYLTNDSPFPGKVKWNFGKFLVDRKGEVVARYGSRTAPSSVDLVADIERELAK